MSCGNLLVLPDRHLTSPDRLETESGVTCADPRGGGWFGRRTEQRQFQYRLQRRAHHRCGV